MATEETVAIFMTSVFLSSLQSEELFLSETGGMNIEQWLIGISDCQLKRGGMTLALVAVAEEML